MTALLSSGAHADTIYFPLGSTVSNIDGDTSDGEWIDANTISSSTGELDTLEDLTGALRNVRVHTKRTATHLYIAFDIEDQSQVGLSLGERVILHIDPDRTFPPATALEPNDLRIEVIQIFPSCFRRLRSMSPC
jgi:hypothetical protein